MAKSILWACMTAKTHTSSPFRREYVSRSVLRARVTAKSHTGAPFGRTVGEFPVLLYSLHIHPSTSTAVRLYTWLAMKTRLKFSPCRLNFCHF